MSLHQCPTCNKSFKSPHAIRSHMNWHNADYFEKQQVPKDYSKAIEANQRELNKRIEKYNLQKKKCMTCSADLEYNQRFYNHCSRKCSTTHANSRLSQTALAIKAEKIRTKLKAKPPRVYPYNNVTLIKCSICNIEKYVKGKGRQTCSIECYQVLASSNSRKDIRCGGFRHKSILYEGFYLDSNYELKLAKDLDQNNIKWIRPKYFNYVDSSDKKRRYTPDFYLPDYDVYIDTKNDYLIKIQQDKLQRASEQNNIKLIIADKNHLTWEKIAQLINGTRGEF